MFSSTIVDVVIGLIFLFMAVSLAASALTEAFASLLKLRHRTLLSGIEALLNDDSTTGLVKDLYNHALVNPLASGEAGKQAVWSSWTTKPAYIEASNFAQALLSTLRSRDQAKQKKVADEARTKGLQPPAVVVKSVSQLVSEIDNDQLRQVLQELLARATNDAEGFLSEIGRWFDDAMDRVSGWYKRYTQVVGFAMALLVAVILNADAIRIGETLWQKPTLVSELSVHDPAPLDPASAAAASPAATAAQNAVKQLEKANLLGWPTDGGGPPNVAVSMVLGWLIVAGASLFGASFWFDLLQKIGPLAGVGPSDDDAKKRAGQPVP